MDKSELKADKSEIKSDSDFAELLSRIKKEHPMLRYGQIIAGAVQMHFSSTPDKIHDIFYDYDHELSAMLLEYRAVLEHAKRITS